MNDKNKIVIFIKRRCYLVIPIVTTLILVILYFILYFNNILINYDENKQTALIGISGTLIGFLFTAMTIFFSLNKDSKYMQNFKRYGHPKIFCRLITFGIIFLCLNILLWIFKANDKIIILTFITGFEETIMSAYYIYKLSLNSFQ